MGRGDHYAIYRLGPPFKGEAHDKNHDRRASQIMEKTVKSRSEAQDKESAEN
jgi:hypothetical protein